MGQPQSHYASMESVRIPAAGEKRMDPNELPRIERDPMTSFEYYHADIQAQLNSWTTFSVGDRKRRAALFGSPILTDAPVEASREMFRWTPARRHKVLNYIIWIESLHPQGNREVAAVAFNALFGKPDKKGD